MSNQIGSYPPVRVDSNGKGIASQADGLLLTDLALSLALGGGCLADVDRLPEHKRASGPGPAQRMLHPHSASA